MTTQYTLEVNNRAFRAIKSGLKSVEYRTNSVSSKINFNNLKEGDKIKFFSELGNDEILVEVIRVTHYNTSKELFKSEGLNNSSSKPRTIEDAVKRLETFTDYKENIKKFGVFAIEFQVID